MEIKHEEDRKFCGLCLESFNNEVVNGVTIEVLEKLGHLLLEPNLLITEDTLICKSCTGKIEKCYNIKTSFLHTEDYISSFSSDNVNSYLYLIGVYQMKNDIKDNIPASHTVCRLCIRLTEYGSCVSLEDEIKDLTSLRILLNMYLSEIDLNKTEDPKICSDCYESLQIYFGFMQKVSGAEKNTKYEVMESIESDGIQNSFNVEEYNKTDIKEVYFYVPGMVKLDNTEDEEIKQEEEVDVKVEPKEADEQDPFAEKMYSCEYCGYKSKRISAVKRHTLKTHVESSKTVELFQCAVCKFETKYNAILQKHMKKHRDPSQMTTYLKHMSIHAEKSYQCDVCGLKLKNKCNMRLHSRLHQKLPEVTMYHCEKCSYRTRYKECFKRHEIVHVTPSEASMYRCVVCGLEMKHKRSLNIHMERHQNSSKLEEYQCEFCDYKSKYKRYLTQHLRVVHDFTKTTWYKCGYCKFKSKYKLSFEHHMVTHACDSDESDL